MTATLAICIGAQKAGTTWLADHLRANDDVHLSPVKEVHFFDSRFAPEWCAKYEAEMLSEFKREAAALNLEGASDPARNQKLAAMLLRFRMVKEPHGYRRFMAWGAGGRRVLFEATPDYALLPEEGFQAMRAAAPDVRLIFLLRNPADRFWSVLRFNRTHNPGFDIEASFDRLIDRDDFRRLADYGGTIGRVRSVFGEERLHVEFYENLFNRRAVEAIERFLGVRPGPADFARRSNASMVLGMPESRRERAVRAYAHVYRDIDEIFPGRLPETWRSDMRRYLN